MMMTLRIVEHKKTITTITPSKGMIYQAKDAMYHQGGGKYQQVALDSFNKALELNGENVSLVIQVNYYKGDRIDL